MADIVPPTSSSDKVGWPSAMVASLVIVLVGAIAVAAIIKYDEPEKALKIWESLSSVVGLISGVFVTYFFTRGQVQAQAQRADSAEAKLTEAENKLVEMRLTNETAHHALTYTTLNVDPSKRDIVLAAAPVRELLGIHD